MWIRCHIVVIDPRWLEFYYNENKKNQVEARSYRYDKNVGGLEGCKKVDMQLLEVHSITMWRLEIISTIPIPWWRTD